jgi:hypothetical protein
MPLARLVEGPNGKFAPRQGPTFIPVHSPQLVCLLRQDCCEFLRPFRRRGQIIHQGFNRCVRRVRSQKAGYEPHLLQRVCSRFIVRIAQSSGQELMARVAHAAQTDLRFGDPACEFLDFGVGVWPGDFARERFHLFGPNRIGIYRQAQAVAECISGGRDPAVGAFWTCAGASIGAIGRDLTLTGQAAFFLPPASSRLLRIGRPQFPASSAAPPRRAPRDADRSRAG